MWRYLGQAVPTTLRKNIMTVHVDVSRENEEESIILHTWAFSDELYFKSVVNPVSNYMVFWC